MLCPYVWGHLCTLDTCLVSFLKTRSRSLACHHKTPILSLHVQVTFWPHLKLTWSRVKNNVALSHILTMQGIHVASLVKFCPLVKEKHDGWTEGGIYNIPIAQVWGYLLVFFLISLQKHMLLVISKNPSARPLDPDFTFMIISSKKPSRKHAYIVLTP